MDHHLIEEQNVAELYAAGQLPPEDEERFEEHLLECRECRERVAWAEDLKDSFQALAAEERSRAAEIGLLAVFLRRGRWLGIAALVLLAVALPAWLLLEQGRLRRELAAARAARPAMAAPPAASAVQAELRAARGRLEGLEAERRTLAGELQAERARREELAGKLTELTRPQVNAALFSLGLVRGGAEENQVTVGAKPAWIVLELELPAADSTAWRATLRDARGRTVWRGEGLRPTARDTVVLGIYSDQLAPGAYRIVLEGVPPQGGVAPVEIPFRVTKQK